MLVSDINEHGELETAVVELLAAPHPEAAGIGQALVLRADHDYNAGQLMAILGRGKTTFPVLSGP